MKLGGLHSEDEITDALEKLLVSDTRVKRQCGRLMATGFAQKVMNWAKAETELGTRPVELVEATTMTLCGLMAGIIVLSLKDNTPPDVAEDFAELVKKMIKDQIVIAIKQARQVAAEGVA